MKKQYNNIDEDIFVKHLEQAYIEQLQRNYKNENYQTYINKKFNNIKTDFIAQKNNEIIIYEMKSINNKKNNKIDELIKVNKKQKDKAKINVSFIKKPLYQEIEIDEIESIIEDDMTRNGIPDELDVLSTHTRIEEISDIEFDAIKISKDEIHITGNGSVCVSLQDGSDSDNEDDDSTFEMSFPFSYKIELNGNLEINNSEYDIDTDDYYE